MNRQNVEIISLETLVGEITDLVADGDPAGAADWLRAIMAHGDDLRRRDTMRPYEDRVPPLLAALPDNVAGAVFDELTPAEARRALFDSHTRVEPALIATILAAMRAERAAAVVEAMSLGVGAPLEMARALPHVPEMALSSLLAHVHPASLARLVREMGLDGQGRLLAAADPDTAAALLMNIAEDDGRVAEARAARMLYTLPPADSNGDSEAAGVHPARPDDDRSTTPGRWPPIRSQRSRDPPVPDRNVRGAGGFRPDPFRAGHRGGCAGGAGRFIGRCLAHCHRRFGTRAGRRSTARAGYGHTPGLSPGGLWIAPSV